MWNHSPGAEPWFEFSRPTTSWVAYRASLGWIGPATWGHHHVDQLENIGSPTPVVRGTDTSAWLSATAALVAERIPSAELVDLPGGHACFLQSPDDFRSALQRHLDAVAT